MSLTDSLGLGGLFGSQASQTSSNTPTSLGQSMWVTTTGNTSGLPLGLGGVGVQQPTINMTSLLQENHALLKEVKDELLDMKKWLMATYPDIYKQYVCVKQLEEASK